MLTPYQFASNRPIDGIDLDGLEWNPYQTYKFWTGFGKSVVKGTWDVISYVANNPNHAGYSYSPDMKPPTEAEIAQYRINWSQQLDPYYQIENFAEGIVLTGEGIYNFGSGIYGGDGEKTAQSIPYVAGAVGMLSPIKISGAQFRRILGARGASRMKGTPSIPIRNLSFKDVRFTSKGVDVVEKHLKRFNTSDYTGSGIQDGPNRVMVDRLRKIADGELTPTDYDLKFYTHELRENSRFRKGGVPDGETSTYDFYDTQHGATLEDYNIPDDPKQLYHPDAQSHPDF